MEQVLADTLTANLKSAHTAEAKQDALILAMIAVVDCQLKTATRVKTMWEERGRALWAGRLVCGLVSGGTFALIVKAMRELGVL